MHLLSMSGVNHKESAVSRSQNKIPALLFTLKNHTQTSLAFKFFSFQLCVQGSHFQYFFASSPLEAKKSQMNFILSCHLTVIDKQTHLLFLSRLDHN